MQKQKEKQKRMYADTPKVFVRTPGFCPTPMVDPPLAPKMQTSRKRAKGNGDKQSIRCRV